jgi:acetylglutamate/LysW-gamma-L-alpha-aminoadipate kinase
MIVVKVGGSRGIDYDAFCDDLAELVRGGSEIVAIHGGSQRMNELASALGQPPVFVTSPSGMTSRWTDEPTMELFQMVYCGRMNKMLVHKLQARGINALGLCGMDGRLWTGARKDAMQVLENGKRIMRRGNLTGKVERVNADLLRQLQAAGLTLLLTPPALSDDLQPINVDGDRAAAQTAIALQATDLLILTNMPGVLRDVDDPASVIPAIDREELESVSQQFAAGRMRIKLLAAQEALDGGVSRVVIANASARQCIRRALAGEGTVIQPSRAAAPLSPAANPD